jgi:hypothetical protein
MVKVPLAEREDAITQLLSKGQGLSAREKREKTRTKTNK